MADDVMVFDIETIPMQGKLSEMQQIEYDKKYIQKIKQRFGDKPEYTKEEQEYARGLTMATNYFLGEVVCIGLYRNDGKGNEGSIALVGTEKEILTRFWKNIKDFKGTFVSFNGNTFDVPFIVKRSLYHKILPTNNNFLDLRRYRRWPHFDVKAVFSDWDNYATGTLASVCDFTGVESPKDGEIKADGVEQAFLNGQINLIGEYCLRDVVATYKVYEQLKNYTYKPSNQY